MYFLVIYQLSGIQAGIQAGHCAQAYDSKYKDDPETWDFIDNHTTWYVMNGGTTNEGSSIIPDYKGTLNIDIAKLEAIGYKHAVFREPDLGDLALSCCFICDERVFNRDTYPDFKFPPLDKRWAPKHSPSGGYYTNKLPDAKVDMFDYDSWLTEAIYEIDRAEAYAEFVKEVGIEVATLKEILKGKSFHL